MIEVTDEEFDEMIGKGIAAIPPTFQKHIDNVAFLVEDMPTPAQVEQLKLYRGELLFGLYEGVPLPQRMGTTKLLPDKITIFKKPAEWVSRTKAELAEHVRHTIWHEVAHYYGLDHKRIHELERPKRAG